MLIEVTSLHGKNEAPLFATVVQQASSMLWDYRPIKMKGAPASDPGRNCAGWNGRQVLGFTANLDSIVHILFAAL